MCSPQIIFSIGTIRDGLQDGSLVSSSKEFLMFLYTHNKKSHKIEFLPWNSLKFQHPVISRGEHTKGILKNICFQ